MPLPSNNALHLPAGLTFVHPPVGECGRYAFIASEREGLWKHRTTMSLSPTLPRTGET